MDEHGGLRGGAEKQKICMMSWNVNGLRDRDRMEDVVRMMKMKSVHVGVLVETHFSKRQVAEFSALAGQDFSCYSAVRLMRRFDRGSGGVTILVDKG